MMSRRGNTWYIAAKHPNETVAAFVFLTKIDKGCWGYKDMDETCGPNASEAPKKLIALLTPTDNAYALAWRQRCLDRKAPKRYAVGAKITLTEAVNFKGYPPQTEFTRIEYHPGKFCWQNPLIGYCRLPTSVLETARLH